MSRRTLSVGQLRECHGPIVLGAGQRPHPLIATVPRDNPGERAPRQKIHQLVKSVLPLFTGASSETLRKVPDPVQIDTTLNRQN